MAARPKRYFDDPEEGPAEATSHPEFVALCRGDRWFYDGANDFAPFGSDAGSDTLSALQDWFRARRRGTVRAFVTRMIKEWDMRLPDLHETRAEVVRGWLADATLDTARGEIDRLLIAAAFGQLKITGAVDADVHDLAIAAAIREEIATAHARAHYPAWKHAPAKQAADAKIRAALDAMAAHRTPRRGSSTGRTPL